MHWQKQLFVKSHYYWSTESSTACTCKFLNQIEQKFFRCSKKIVDVTISRCCGDISQIFSYCGFLEKSYTIWEGTKIKAVLRWKQQLTPDLPRQGQNEINIQALSWLSHVKLKLLRIVCNQRKLCHDTVKEKKCEQIH